MSAKFRFQTLAIYPVIELTSSAFKKIDLIDDSYFLRDFGLAAKLRTFTFMFNPNKDKYIYGETVKFKITVTNTAAYAITDVYLEEELCLGGIIHSDGGPVGNAVDIIEKRAGVDILKLFGYRRAFYHLPES